MEKFYGKFSEQNAESQESVSDGLIVNVDETCNGQFESLIDPWGHYIRFSEIFHSEASRSDVIHVVEASTCVPGWFPQADRDTRSMTSSIITADNLLRRRKNLRQRKNLLQQKNLLLRKSLLPRKSLLQRYGGRLYRAGRLCCFR